MCATLSTSPSVHSPLRFEVLATKGKARAGLLHLPHGTIETPVFMPVGTLANVKSLDGRDLEDLGRPDHS
jgi:queuine tRNA-ribosyltransferase